ncbi:substrate-binding domain-containing protein [Plantactinospora sp. S1510]|uniref:Substrate-binding domain-containing protein n=1 Tax=Plantactinospora alkalitolerans TaxID=2789879 RepID=A0ABS0H7U4_9ACTN|nr:substrate-binding domain-containing protein [Plantactinospora alkalitolerans]MBF9134538.1 substrate-binding domain-containing protein [Plantactinospora alkalitolerans]
MANGGLRTRPEFWPVLLLSGALVAVLGGWGASNYLERTRQEPPCTRRTALRIAVAPSVEPPARQVARDLVARERCLDVLVEARESADVLRDLTSRAADGAATGTVPSTAAATAAAPPDAWLPESTLWLRRARAAGAFEVPAEGVSVASTPVVLSLDERSHARLRRDRALGWNALVAAERPPLPVALPDPTASPLGFGALVAVRALADTAQPSNGAAGAAAIMRRLAARTVPFPGAAPVPTGPGAAESAVVSTEQDVLLTAAAGGTRQVAVYPPNPVPGPDYPFAILTADAPREGAAAFLRGMLAAEGAAAVTGHGLRTPSGGPPASITEGSGIRAGAYPPPPLPAEADATALINAWGGVHISARMLAVLDVSGSMAARLPGSAQTRISATIKAAKGGAELLLGTTELGVWEFSTDLDGERDYREVVPVGPVGPRRAEIAKALDGVRVKPNGATGLYDTTLAAYRDATRNWTAGRINMVLVLTDGTDDNASGISRAKLLDELAGLRDKRRPVPILFIGVGSEIDSDELRQIARATGGRVALTPRPSGIQQIFFSALAEFSCLPPKCRR